MQKDKEFRIVRFWIFFIVQRLVDESYWFWFKKTRKVRNALTIMGHTVFSGFLPNTCESKRDAKKFIERMEKKEKSRKEINAGEPITYSVISIW